MILRLHITIRTENYLTTSAIILCESSAASWRFCCHLLFSCLLDETLNLTLQVLNVTARQKSWATAGRKGLPTCMGHWRQMAIRETMPGKSSAKPKGSRQNRRN